MKLKCKVAFQAFFICLLISGFSIIPMRGISQNSVNTFTLNSVSETTNTDVSASLVYDSNLERYTLNVVNPSRKKLKIYFYARGQKYIYRASLAKFSKPFDLAGVEDGVYAFGIKDGKVLLKTDVTIKTINVTKRETIFASRL